MSSKSSGVGLLGYRKFRETALEDVYQAAREVANDGNNQFYRRAFVRALFAFIEADVWGRKSVALYFRDKAHLTDLEVAAASEHTPDLDEKGRVIGKSPRLQLKPNVLFSFQVFARAFEVRDFHLATNDHGWQAFRTAIAIRNRLMHPKSRDDLSISDDDLQTCCDALNWYEAESARVATLAAESLES
ncbi:MAG: hypothetical protein U0Q18_22140 [Bryobacteraceae bacterium]